jgi:hypothetical protein
MADDTPGLSVGVQGGVVSSSFSTTAFPTASRAALNLGGQVEIPIFSSFYIVPELLYVQMGVKPAADYITNQLKLSDDVVRYDEIELPVLAKWKQSLFGPLRLEVFAGPSLGFAVNRSEVQTPPGGGPTPAIDRSSYYDTVDVSLHFGLGFELDLVSGVSAYLDGRYLLGLTDINNPSGSASLTPIYNRAILVSLGARLRL